MRQPTRVVAVLAANPALSSLLAMMLAADPTLRVRQFEGQLGLTTYMQLAPVDLVVIDFDCEAAPAATLARALRFDTTLVRRDFRIIALARTVTENTKQASVALGIDEVIVKPMSPKYLLERVRSRLRPGTAHIAGDSGYQGPERRDRLPTGDAEFGLYARRTDKVVPLFRERLQPQS